MLFFSFFLSEPRKPLSSSMMTSSGHVAVVVAESEASSSPSSPSPAPADGVALTTSHKGQRPNYQNQGFFLLFLSFFHSFFFPFFGTFWFQGELRSCDVGGRTGVEVSFFWKDFGVCFFWK